MGVRESSVVKEQSRTDLEVVLEAARDLVDHLDLPLVLERSVEALRRLVEFDSFEILLMENGVLGVVASDWVEGEASDEHLVEEPLIARGELLGILRIWIATPPNGERDLLRTFLPFMSSAIANAREYEEQRALTERSQEEQRVHKDFLSVVSHELRTPLAVVMGYAETLARNVEHLNPEQVVSISARTRDASRRLARLIGDLFDLAQADRGTLDVKLYPTSVERVLAQASFETQSPKHRLEVVCEPNLPPVLADRDRLNQVVVNLVSNAKRYSAEGSRVKVEARHIDGAVEISVEDEGIGIPPEMTARIFERFFQRDDPEARRPGGLGVGLFLVKEICERMNASIEVDSRPGRGSRFTVKIPVAPHPAT